MGFSRQEYWNRLPFPTPGDLPNLSYLLFISLHFLIYKVLMEKMKSAFSLVAESRGDSSLQGFSFWWFLLLQSTGSRHAGFFLVVAGHGLSS